MSHSLFYHWPAGYALTLVGTQECSPPAPGEESLGIGVFSGVRFLSTVAELMFIETARVSKSLPAVFPPKCFFLLCECLCLERFEESTKAFPQSSQRYGLSPVWIRWCRTRSPDLIKVFLQSLQMNGLSPVWIRWCSTR